MDTYENNIPQEEDKEFPQVEFSNQQTTYTPREEPFQSAASWDSHPTFAPKKKASPYENSPYMSYGSYQQAYAPREPKKKRKLWKPLLAILLAVCLAAGACIVTANVVNEKWEDRFEKLTEQFESQMDILEKKVNSAGDVVLTPGVNADNGALYTPAQVYAANVKSVVMISNKVTTGQNGICVSTGSGFIVTKDGYVVTNQHVVDGKGSITVITTDGTEYPAVLVGADDTNDVALLKVDALNLRPVTLGSSAELIVGDQVAAIGNPLGTLTSTLTVGYVSAKERDVTTDGFAINMLQTDAAINSGNSGGPLFNMRGEVVGITTAKYSGTSASGASIEGVGFAIPIDDVIDILPDLANYGYVNSSYLGVMVSDMNQDAASYYGIPVGAYIQEITPGYAAQKAGLRAKDIIVELGGYEVRNVNGLTRALRHFKAGDETAIVVYRGGQKLTFMIVLDEKPADLNEPTTPETTPQEENGGNSSKEWWYDFLPPIFGYGDQD